MYSIKKIYINAKKKKNESKGKGNALMKDYCRKGGFDSFYNGNGFIYTYMNTNFHNILLSPIWSDFYLTSFQINCRFPRVGGSSIFFFFPINHRVEISRIL